MPFFSVIIPVFNTEKYLPTCIDSVMNQSFRDFELILVDDGSTDRSPVICDEYSKKDSRVKTIHKQHEGAMSARKVGTSNSVGEYISYVDSDDYVSPDFLEHFFGIIQKVPADIVAIGHTRVTEEADIIQTCPNALPEGLYEGTGIFAIRNRMLFDHTRPFPNMGCLTFSQCLKVFKRSLILPSQMDPPNEIRNGEDLAVTACAVGLAEGIYISNYCGYFYRMRNTSTIHTFDKRETKGVMILGDYLINKKPTIPKQNCIIYLSIMLRKHLIEAANHMDSLKQFKQYAEQECGEVINCIIAYMDSIKMPVRGVVRLLPIKYRWWTLFWLKYRKP